MLDHFKNLFCIGRKYSEIAMHMEKHSKLQLAIMGSKMNCRSHPLLPHSGLRMQRTSPSLTQMKNKCIIVQEAGFWNAVSPEEEKCIQKYIPKFYPVSWDAHLISLNFHAIFVIISPHQDFNIFEIWGHFSPKPTKCHNAKMKSCISISKCCVFPLFSKWLNF